MKTTVIINTLIISILGLASTHAGSCYLSTASGSSKSISSSSGSLSSSDDVVRTSSSSSSSGLPSSWTFIQNKAHAGSRLQQQDDSSNIPSSAGRLVQGIPSSNAGYNTNWVQWKFISAGSGYYRLQSKHASYHLQQQDDASQIPSTPGKKVHGVVTSSGNWVQWKLNPIDSTWYKIQNKSHGGVILQMQDDTSSAGGRKVHGVASSTGGNWVQWRLINAN